MSSDAPAGLREDRQLADLARRLIGDLDSIEASRHMAVYERDARLVARAYLAVLDERDTLKEALEEIASFESSLVANAYGQSRSFRIAAGALARLPAAEEPTG